jgi:hypothetical protein
MRDLTSDERGRDFDELVSLFKAYYGPYSYKETTLKISIDQLASTLRPLAASAKTDEEFAGIVMRFGAALKDGHVQIQIENTSSGISRYKIPIVLTPVAGHVLIGDLSDELKKFTGFSAGDEVLEVDGKAPLDYLPTVLKYRSAARDASNQHYVYYVMQRPSYMTDLVPTSKTARLKVKTQAGDLITIDVPWQTDKYNADLGSLVKNDTQQGSSVPSWRDLRVPFADEINSTFDGNIKQMGQVDPVFVTAKTQKKFKFVKVYPSDATRKKYGLADTDKPPIFAALYKYGGKTILLVRQATYAPSDFKTDVYLKAYMALFDDYQDIADVLVLDQTHNPGGSYCAEFYDLFARQGDTQGAELLHADRKWINDLKVNDFASAPASSTVGFDAKTEESWGLLVEKAYDQGAALSDPIPLFSGSFFSQKRDMTWDKPMLVLIDELAGSCGDMFPMLVKANKRAKLFGQTTMGLGGNVEEVGILTNSRIHLRLTRGMFFPYHENTPPSDFVENNGVAPDYEYSLTLDGVRGGFVDYVKAFSDKAIEQN